MKRVGLRTDKGGIMLVLCTPPRPLVGESEQCASAEVTGKEFHAEPRRHGELGQRSGRIGPVGEGQAVTALADMHMHDFFREGQSTARCTVSGCRITGSVRCIVA